MISFPWDVSIRHNLSCFMAVWMIAILSVVLPLHAKVWLRVISQQNRQLAGFPWQPSTVGSEFNAAPAATDRSHEHRSRSTWGLVSRSIGSISSSVFHHLPYSGKKDHEKNKPAVLPSLIQRQIPIPLCSKLLMLGTSPPVVFSRRALWARAF